MGEYRSKIPSFGNDRLNTILKKFYDKKLNITSYGEYNDKIRDEKKNRDIKNIVAQTRQELQNLYDKIQAEIKQIATELSNSLYPNISKDISLTGEKLFGAIEFSNALNIVQMQPDNIHQILKTAIEHKRFDFVFPVLSLFSEKKDLPMSYRKKIDPIQDNLYKQFGYTEMNQKKERLEYELLECEDQIKLVERSPEEFEANIISSIKVAQRMKEVGQLEGDTILLK